VRAGVVLACGSLTVIDPKTNTAISTINIGASLEAGVVDDKGTVFVFRRRET
jgi:YVTN family beta-propeller protein